MLTKEDKDKFYTQAAFKMLNGKKLKHIGGIATNDKVLKSLVAIAKKRYGDYCGNLPCKTEQEVLEIFNIAKEIARQRLVISDEVSKRREAHE